MNKNHLYATAYCPSLKRYCAIVRWDEGADMFLVNFGHANVWMRHDELENFVL